MEDKPKDDKSSFERVKSIPLVKWTAQKTSDAANALKSTTDHYIPGSGKVIDKVGTATAASVSYIGEKLGPLVPEKVKSFGEKVNEYSNKGLDAVEKKYPVINKPVDELAEHSKQAATDKALGHFGLSKSKVDEDSEVVGETQEKDEKVFSLKSNVSVEMKTPEGFQYKLNYEPFNLKDNVVYKTVAKLWPKTD